MRISKNSVFVSAFSLTLSNITLQLLGFVYRVVLGRMTGAEGMGVYQLILPFYSVLISLTMSGLTVAVSRITAEYGAFGDDASARRAVGISQALFLALFAPVAIFTVNRAGWIGNVVLGNEKTCAALYIILPCLLLTGFENIHKNYFFGRKKLTPPIISELTEQSVRIIAVITLIWLFNTSDPGINAFLIVSGMTVSEIVSVIILSCVYSRRGPRRLDAKPVPAFGLFAKICSVALPISAAGALNNILSSANSVLVPRMLVSSGMDMNAALGEFGMLFGMIIPVLYLPVAFISPLTVIMVPRLSEKVAVKNLSDVRRKAGKTIHVTGLMAFPAMAALIPLGEVFCRLIYNQSGTGKYILPLCIATVFSYYQITTNTVLNGIGQQRRAAAHVVFGNIIQLFFTLGAGLPRVGMSGYIAGYIISDVFMVVLNIHCIIKKLKMRIRWFNWFFIPVICSALSGLIINLAYTLLRFDGVGEWHALLVSLVMGALSYLICLNLMGTSITGYIKKLIPKNRDA